MGTIPQTQLEFKFSGTVVSAEEIAISYTSLIGANPKDQGYFVAIWQGSQIQDIKDAKQVQAIEKPNVEGSLTFTGLANTTYQYIIGIGVNNKDGSASICATLDLPQNAAQFSALTNPVISHISLQLKLPNTVGVSYTTPSYNNPAENKNWLAIFEGTFNARMYKGENVIASDFATGTTNIGGMSLNGLNLKAYTKYTLVYGMGADAATGKPNFKNLVAATEFNN